MLKVNLIEWTRTHQGSIDHIRTIIPIENYTYYKLSVYIYIYIYYIEPNEGIHKGWSEYGDIQIML